MKTTRKNAGFTLVEMLIVVAIIAILIAVSIPMVNSSLEKARKATDSANERAAKAAASIEFLNGDADDKFNDSGVTGFYYYDAISGSLVYTQDATVYPEAYGKCSDGEHDGCIIRFTLNTEGTFVNFEWVNYEGDDPEPNDYLHNGYVAGKTPVT